MLKKATIFFLLAAMVLPAGLAEAQVTPYPLSRGQSIDITKSGLNPANVNILMADLESVGSQFGVSIFGIDYKVDIANTQFQNASNAPVNGLTITPGKKINIIGSLDPVDPLLIHAYIVRDTGVVSGGGDTPPTGSLDPVGGTPGSTTGICASGGQDSNQGGTVETFGEPVVGLVRQALGCASLWTFTAHPNFATGRTPNATINQRFLWLTWYYGWAMRAGTEAQKTDARQKLIKFFEDQKLGGHYSNAQGGTEILTTSHYQIWSLAAAGARFLAFHYKDPALLAATGQWWRGEKALWDELQQNGSIRAPGGRFDHSNTDPVSLLRDVNYALISGRAIPAGSPSSADSPWWSQYYNASAWIIRAAISRGDDVGGAARATRADLPKLPYVMCIYRRSSDYVYSFPRMPRTYYPLFWVSRVGGIQSKEPYFGQTGREASSASAPALSGSTLTVLPGVIGTSSDCQAPGTPGPATTTVPTNTTPTGGGGVGGDGGPVDPGWEPLLY